MILNFLAHYVWVGLRVAGRGLVVQGLVGLGLRMLLVLGSDWFFRKILIWKVREIFWRIYDYIYDWFGLILLAWGWAVVLIEVGKFRHNFWDKFICTSFFFNLIICLLGFYVLNDILELLNFFWKFWTYSFYFLMLLVFYLILVLRVGVIHILISGEFFYFLFWCSFFW